MRWGLKEARVHKFIGNEFEQLQLARRVDYKEVVHKTTSRRTETGYKAEQQGRVGTGPRRPGSALYSKSGGCVVTVHVLIWGDLLCRRPIVGRATGSNARRVVTEVSSGHSSDGGRIAITAKDQRNKAGQRW